MRHLRVVLLLAMVACEKKTPTALDAAPPVASAAPPDRPRDVMTGIRIPPLEATTVQLAWKTPPGTEVNAEAPFRILWDQSEGLAEAPADVRSTGSAVKNGFAVKVRPTPSAAKASLAGELSIVVCEAKNKSVCLPVKRRIELGFVVLPDAGAADPTLAIVLPSAK